MALYQVSFAWEFPGDDDTRIAGWSETYYQSIGNHAAAMAEALRMLAIRVQLSSQPVIVRDVRVSDVDIPGDALTQFKFLPRPPLWASGNCDVPWNAALFRMEDAAHRTRRFVYVRGIPDFVYNTRPRAGQEQIDYNTWLAKQQQWQEYMRAGANNWSMRVKTKPNIAQRINVVGITNVGHVWTITTDQPHGIVVGGQFTLYNIRKAPPLRGIHNAIAPTTTTTLTFQAEYDTGFLYLGKAYIFPVTYTPVPISGTVWEGITRRATGRPSDLSRGRRAVVKR